MALPDLAPLNPVAMDRFTEMAAGGLDVPVACLSLVGTDRRLLTSSYGLPAPVALLLSWSLLKQLPASGSPLLVTDGRSDPLLAQTPPVRDGMVTAYVGLRLVASDGRAVGTMSVMDQKPRQWNPSQIDFLQNLCALIVRRLESGNGARLTAPKELVHLGGRASAALARRTYVPLHPVDGFSDGSIVSNFRRSRRGALAPPAETGLAGNETGTRGGA